MIERKLPIGTTLEEWKAEVRRLYPTAQFQHHAALRKWHASIGVFRKGTWYGHYEGGPDHYTQAWILE